MYGEKINWFTRFMLRFQASPLDIVKAEYQLAELAALQADSRAEYAGLEVKMNELTADYHKKRMVRLGEFIDDQTKEKNVIELVEFA